MVNPKAGGTIYQWTLGHRASAYQAAAKFGHADVLRLLMEPSPLEAQLIAACWLHDSATVASLRSQHPSIPTSRNICAKPIATRLPRPRATMTRRQSS